MWENSGKSLARTENVWYTEKKEQATATAQKTAGHLQMSGLKSCVAESVKERI